MAKYYEEHNADGGNSLRFLAVADKPLSVFTDEHGTAGDFPVAELEVLPPGELTTFDKHLYDLDIDLPATSASAIGGRMATQGYDEDEIRKAMDKQTNTPQMFYSEPAEIVGLYADPSMRHTVGTLGGLAVNQFGKIRADSNLSKYSSRIVRRGIDAGLVEANPLNIGAASNFNTDISPVTEEFNVESSTRPTIIPPGFISEISRPRVDHARKTVHGMLRPKTSSEQFGPFQPDPKLPGMENY